MAVDTANLERELCRIPEVYAARIVTNGSGSLTQARILASPRRPPKRVRRDVQSVAMASFGVDLEPAMIMVTQLDQAAMTSDSAGASAAEVAVTEPEPAEHEVTEDEEPMTIQEPGAAPPAPEEMGVATEPHGEERSEASRSPSRMQIEVARVTSTVEGHRCSVEVTLSRGGASGSSRAEGPLTRAAGGRLAAKATLGALGKLDGVWSAAEVEDAAFTQLGQSQIALAAFVLA
ncbi:MAG: hypothetical protein ACRD1G_12535, partial [Acidimicrobiales bacterium]